MAVLGGIEASVYIQYKVLFHTTILNLVCLFHFVVRFSCSNMTRETKDISGVLLNKFLVVKKDKSFLKFDIGVQIGYKMEVKIVYQHMYPKMYPKCTLIPK